MYEINHSDERIKYYEAVLQWQCSACNRLHRRNITDYSTGQFGQLTITNSDNKSSTELFIQHPVNLTCE